MTDWLRVQNDLDTSGAALSWTPGGPIANGLTASCDVWLPTTTVASIGAAGTTASWIHIAANGGDAGQVLGAIQGDLSVLQQNSRSPNAAAGAIPKSTSFNVSIQLVHTTTFNWTVTVQIDGVTVDTYTANLGFNNLATLNFVQFGASNPFGATDEVYFVTNCVVLDDTGSPWFSDDLSDVVLPGTLGPWTAVSGDDADLSIVTTPADSAGGGGGGPYTGYAPSFAINNVTQGGTAISTVSPVANSLEWTYRLAQVGGPGDAQWEVALSDPDLAADDFAPKRTDWELVMDGTTTLCAGILTSVNVLSESDSGVFGVVRCQGLDWLHYLEQPYGFDYADVASDQRTNQLSDHDRLWRIFTTTASGAVAGVTYAATQQDVVDDLLDSLSGYTGTVAFTPVYNGSGWTEGVNMNIGFGDDATVLDMILSLAQLDSPYGFDIFVTPDKTIEMYAPRRVDPASVSPLYTLNDSSIVAPPLDWTNNGPNSSDTVMLGTGSGNTRSVGYSTYSPTQATYRQWVRIGQVDFPDQFSANTAAASSGYWDRFPHKDLKLTIRPDLLDPADATQGFLNMLGEAIAVDYDVASYHHIDANFWVTEQHYYSPDGCNWLADFTLSQIYTTAATPSP